MGSLCPASVCPVVFAIIVTAYVFQEISSRIRTYQLSQFTIRIQKPRIVVMMRISFVEFMLRSIISDNQ